MSATDSVQKRSITKKSFVFAQYKNEWKDTKIWQKSNKVNKKEFHKSKKQIDLDLTNVDQIVVSDK